MASKDLLGYRSFIERVQRLNTPHKRPYDGWIMVGDADWDTGFQNGWSNLGGSYPPLSYHMSGEGKVYIRGAVDGGAIGSVIFTLPEGFWPEYVEVFIVAAIGGGSCQVEISTTGDVSFVG